MRHRKNTAKLSRTPSHRRCLKANMLKSLIVEGKIVTTVPKAKVMRRYADKMVTLAKKNTLASRRRAIADLMIRFNSLTSKEAREVRLGDKKSYNNDRKVIDQLFNTLGNRFSDRNGGYTRIVKYRNRVGDNASLCLLEFLD